MRDLKIDLQWLEDKAPEAHPVREFIQRAMAAENTLAQVQAILPTAVTAAEKIKRIQEVLPR